MMKGSQSAKSSSFKTRSFNRLKAALDKFAAWIARDTAYSAEVHRRILKHKEQMFLRCMRNGNHFPPY